MTSFQTQILPMLSWFYIQDRYLSCPRIILRSNFHPQEANDTKKGIAIPNPHQTCCFGYCNQYVLCSSRFCDSRGTYHDKQLVTRANPHKSLLLLMRTANSNKKNLNLGPPMSTSEKSDFFLKLVSKQICQIWC